MVQIPRSKRLVSLPGGGDLPSPSGQRVSLAGETGRAFAGFGKTLADIGFMAQKANDNAELEKSTIDVQSKWNEAQADLKRKISDPNQYSIAANKELNRIVSDAQKNIGRRNRQRFGNVLGQLRLSADTQISREGFGKTVDSSMATLDIWARQAREDALSGRAELAPVKAGFEMAVKDRVRNGILNPNKAGDIITKFNEDLSWDVFLRDAQADPKNTNAKTREELQKAYGLTGEQATKAKFTADKLDKKETVKIAASVTNHLNSIQVTGIGDPEARQLAAANMTAEQFGLFEQSEQDALTIFEDKETGKLMTDSDIISKSRDLQKEVLKGGKEFTRNKTRLDAFIKTTSEEQEQREDDPFLSVLAPADVEAEAFINTEDQVDEMLARQSSLGIIETKVATVKQKKDIVNRFVKGDTDSRVAMITQLSQEYGRYSERLMSELFEEDMPIEANFMNLFEVTDNLAKNNLGAMIGLKLSDLRKGIDDKNITTETLESVNEGFEDFVETLQPANVEQKLLYRDLVQRYALFLLADKQESDSKDAAERANNELFNNRYEYSNTLRIPKGQGYEKDQVESFLKIKEQVLLDEQEIVFGDDFETSLIPGQLEAQGEWFINGDESGARLYIEGVPALIRKPDGSLQEIEVSFADMMKVQIEIGIEIDPLVPLRRRKVKRIIPFGEFGTTTGEF